MNKIECHFTGELVKESEIRYTDDTEVPYSQQAIDDGNVIESAEGHFIEEDNCDYVYCEDDGLRYYYDNCDIRYCENRGCYYLRENTFYCDNCGYTYHEDYYGGDGMCEECYEEDDGDNYRFSYHSGEGRGDCSHGYRYTIGFELEKEDIGVLQNNDKWQVLDDTGWTVEADCSLDDYEGFEAISPVLPLKIGELRKEFSRPIVNGFVKANYTHRCGGHTTIGDRRRSADELIDDIAGYFPLVYALYPNRMNSHYCSPTSKEKTKENATHNAVTRKGYSAVEFRIFPATDSVEELLDRARLLKYILQHKAPTLEEALDKLANDDRFRALIRKLMRKEDSGERDTVNRYLDRVSKISREMKDKDWQLKRGSITKLRKEM